MFQNESDDTATLPCYQDGDPTIELPKLDDTAKLPRVKLRMTARELMRYVLSSRLVQWLLVGNGFVVLAGVGLFIGYLAAMEAGVVPNPVPGIVKSGPKPEINKTPDDKKEHASPTASSPSDWATAVKPPATTKDKGSPSPEASASMSASSSPSVSSSASAQPEVSASATQSAPETTAPATTPSASTSTPTSETSSPETEPTGPTSDTPAPPTGGTASTSPETEEGPTVTP